MMTTFDHVVELALAGKSLAEICEEAGVSYGTAKVYTSRARSAGVALPRYASGRRAGLGIGRVDKVTSDAISRAARSRSIPRSVLCSRLLTAISHDRLIDAILDDGVRTDGLA